MDTDSAADQVALRALQSAYGDAVTRQDWPAVVALFVPEATVTLELGRGEPRVLGPVELVAFVEQAVSRFELFLFTILNQVVAPDGDGATGRLYLAEVRQDHDGRASVAYGCYHDRYVRTSEGWRIAARRYRSMARTATPGSTTDLEVVRHEVPDR
ncbi:nuclear transport factor 2 family protein [Iamia sp. SCSIO 61187]|uniref:nuclear transport factor 2 family protein n=1 Tax=Iamia sp. SCSIO 61187 TaxID=2722752 RepID=UPI001C6359CF|nr:nuclear transport factor 2 family protein [Iamia sp. SCSIO 61187]QYG93037.1 nuclear transport factor 2 family protein [Iamia sp. SCSIO 61187]